MKIFQLKIKGLRNLSDINIQPNSHFNLFYGLNGSGKTSLLESIYLLAFGRSFRGPHLNPLIHYQAPSLASFAALIDSNKNRYMLGLEKFRQHRVQLKIDGCAAPNLSQAAHLLPIQILCPDSFSLLTGGPELRRQFLDWGVFHVEHLFFDAWSKYTRALRQRNAILKGRSFSRPVKAEIKAWDLELIRAGNELTCYRKAYIEKFLLKLQPTLNSLLPLNHFNISYFQGWDSGRSLEEALEESLAGDLKLGFTRVGPQRADLLCTTNNLSVGQTLSRGQQKLFICALILARGAFFQEGAQKECIYLVDDLASELDEEYRRKVMEQVALSNSQVFITGIEAAFLRESALGFDYKMFHVEHGAIRPN